MSADDAPDESLHVLVVGAGPVEAMAGGADTKIVITLSRSWWQPVMDRLFRNLLEQRVTSEAPANWLGQVEKVEAPEYLKQLCPGVRSPGQSSPKSPLPALISRGRE